jgi:transposase
MITSELEARIRRLFEVEGWPVGTIARELRVHHSVVRRVLGTSGDRVSAVRPSRLDPYLPYVREVLEKYPRLRASRLWRMVQARGYAGGEDHFRHLVARLRPRPPAEAYARLAVLPGEQAQADWAHFGTLAVGRAVRKLVAFVICLSWSRALFLRFYLDQRTPNFLRGHVAAFARWTGCPRVVLYDNLKSAVLERHADALRLNPEIVALAAHYRFEPRPVAVARGNEKGRVERAIQYVRHAFFAAREYTDLADLNAQADAWCTGEALDRPWPQDRRRTVRAAFEEERERLLPVPDDVPPTDERVEVRVGKTPYVRFDGNDYSVPHALVRRVLSVVADETTVRVLDGIAVAATHPRSYDAGQVIEDPAHVAALVAEKRRARQGRGMDRLQRAVPASQALLQGVAERGGGLGGAVAALLRLLDAYGAAETESAISEALARGAPHPHAVRHVLERRRRERDEPLPIAVALPDDPRVRDLVIRPHALDSYDTLHPEVTDDDSL